MLQNILLTVFFVSTAVAFVGRQLLTKSIRRRQGPILHTIATPWRWLYERTGQFIGFAFVTYALAGYPVPGVFSDYWLLKVLGAGLLVFGVVVHLCAKYDLGSNWTNAKDGPTVYRGRITQHGLYRYSRNPMYTSTLAMVFGVVCMTQNIFAIVLWIFLFGYFRHVIIEEESLLRRTKGREYTEYCSRVRRFL